MTDRSGSITDSASVFFAVSQRGQVSWWRGGRILEVLDEILLETTPCVLHVGTVTYFRGDVLHFFLRDPPPDSRNDIAVPFSPDAWRFYYAPILEIIKSANPDASFMREGALISVDGADLKVGIHPKVGHLLADGRWEAARLFASDAAQQLARDGYQPDGLVVRAGETWTQRFTG